MSAHKVFSISPKPTLANSISNFLPLNPFGKVEFRDKIQFEIKQDLYNSISTGMSYDEVRAIIGWDGILIYESQVETAGGQVREQIYQWNNDDIYLREYPFESRSDRSLYGSATLEFENDILIKKSSDNLPP